MKRDALLSKFRMLYKHRFVVRCAVLALTLALFFLAPEQFDVLSGYAFFHQFSIFHVLWIIWVVDMLLQLVPSRKYWPLGSQKFLKACFQPLKAYMEKTDQGLLRFIYKSNRDTLLVGSIWLLLIIVIGVLHFTGVLSRNVLMVISVLFYVLDLVCVLYWCPFRVWFMKNRCCTTCRIFNWDHMMMFSPILFVPGFFTWSLCALALLVFLVWEITFSLHPERFWEGTNEALKCSNCTDRLCGERNCRVDVPDFSALKRNQNEREN